MKRLRVERKGSERKMRRMGQNFLPGVGQPQPHFSYTKRRNHAHGFHRRATTSPRRPPRHPLGWLKGRLFGPPPQGDPFFCARSDDAGCLRDGPPSGAQFRYATKSFRCPTRTEEALEGDRKGSSEPPRGLPQRPDAAEVLRGIIHPTRPRALWVRELRAPCKEGHSCGGAIPGKATPRASEAPR